MKIDRQLLIDLAKLWEAQVKHHNDDACAIMKRKPSETFPHLPVELAENVFGVAAGYAAARRELLDVINVCSFCTGSGSMFQGGTTTMRVPCPKCNGTGYGNAL